MIYWLNAWLINLWTTVATSVCMTGGVTQYSIKGAECRILLDIVNSVISSQFFWVYTICWFVWFSYCVTYKCTFTDKQISKICTWNNLFLVRNLLQHKQHRKDFAYSKIFYLCFFFSRFNVTLIRNANTCIWLYVTPILLFHIAYNDCWNIVNKPHLFTHTCKQSINWI